MPLRLDIKKKLSSRSERVKSVDLHPTEPWVLSGLYNGTVMVWDYDKQQLVKSFEVSTLPVRNARFIARKQWIVASSDDLQLRVFNYNTMDKVTSFDAHADYIRYLEVHPVLPVILSCADDMTVKMWDWEKNWLCTQVFEGHGHYVMMAKFNPKDTNTFATGSLDRTIRVWGLGSSHPHFTLEGHERGVNCIDYYPGGDKPYLISGSDDKTVKVWDYQTKTIVHTLDGHTHNLADVLYHPRLPLIISACEDGAVRMWHSTTYRAETTLNYGMERAWCLAGLDSSNVLAIGYDEGSVVLRLGHDTPVVSMDTTGKLIWANNNEIQTASVKGVVAELGLKDGERVPLPGRDLGSCEVFPQKLKHNANGRFVAICGDGEYIIYTSQQLRNKSFGSALDFVWSPTGTGDYVVRESSSKVVLFKNFVQVKALKPTQCTAEGLFGGALIGIRGPDCIAFYDWDNDMRFIRKIDATVKNVFWSDAGDLVVLSTDSSYYVLRYNREAVAMSNLNAPDGVEGAFDLVHELSEKVSSGTWVGDCFLYVNSSGRLNYYVGGEIMTITHLPSKMYLLGYLPKENVVFLMDKQKNVTSFTVHLVLLEYQTAVVRHDFDTANAILPRIPPELMDNVARFLESQGYKEEALVLSTDPDQKFDLAVQLAKLDVAKDIMMAREHDQHASATDTQHKWKQLGDLALNDGNYALAEDCALRSDDLSLLLLLYTSRGDRVKLASLAELATTKGRHNIAFVSLFFLGQLKECVKLLVESKRLPEAAFFARSYDPTAIDVVLGAWREDLAQVSSRAAKALADPAKNVELFENFDKSIRAAQVVAQQRHVVYPAAEYTARVPLLDVHVLDRGSVAETDVPERSFAQEHGSGAAEAKQRQEAHAAELQAEREAEVRAQAEARANAEAVARAEAEARAHAEAVAEAEAQARAQAEAHARALADAQARQARALAEEKAKAEAEARAREEARLRAEAEEEARRQEEARAKAEAEAAARAKAEAEAAARAEAEAEAAARAKAEAEAAARAKAEAEAAAQAEARAAEDARLKAAAAKAEEDARLRAEAQAKADAEARAYAEAQEQACLQAQAEAARFAAPPSVASAAAAADVLDFGLKSDEEIDFDDDDADWGEM
ncbi:hypothetical protein H310_09830 [Aphanomyces invadans]|uniref:Beta'-coat protein n=1 Tax=Aphanomyces invadans TaxID=157072 RepID=A0A024TTP2_9STRA|nr:hypothetical protein H310_09830 [Aphanomyces invadans]ETV96981.1 hypothetical protein H310_09830 [Aphanomyces invadans]|eukprot:XP_008874227.1 hypothetical protein H310_09830 [Aphanomyces invadans]